MKFFIYIFAFYLVYLSVFPCCEIDNCNEERTEQSSSQGEEKDDCGNCSPFFSCEGCATATLNYQPQCIEFFSSPVIMMYAQFVELSLPQVDFDFWQPPRLG